MSSNQNIPDIQRALVLQGGGALGAYDAGVFQALYDNINTDDGRPLFDIVAGTSSGAMNAAIIVSNVIEKGWDYSVSKLNEFWEYVATTPYIQNIPGFNTWWTNLHNMNSNVKLQMRLQEDITLQSNLCIQVFPMYFIL